MRLRTIFLVGVPLILAAAPFGYSLTQTASLPKLAQARADGGGKAAQKLCASRIVNDRLKAQLFNEAAAVGGGASSNLDLLASFSEVRMEQPVLKEQDDALGVTVCEGRFVVLLPPGSERGFGGMRVLSAEVEYAAQPAADGSGLVYQLKGADSIVYRIAAFSLRHHTIVPRDTQLAKAEPAPDMPLAVEPEVWPELAKAAEPLAPEALPLAPVAPVQVATVEKPAIVSPPEPVRLPKAEPKKPVKAEPKPQPERLAKAEPKPKKEPERLAARVEPRSKPEVKKAPVKLAAKAEPRKPEPKAKPVQLAAVVKKQPPVPAKPKAKPTATAKPREQKPTQLAAVTKPTAAKPAVKPPVKKEAPVQVAQKKPVVVAKPKVQLAAATTKKPAEPQRDLAANSFLAYEQARQRKDAPAPQPVVQKASAPVPRNDCSSGGIEARLICTNPGLASKQRAANNFYYASLEQANQAARRELTGSRNRFLAYLDRCRSAACASAAYDDRMAEIRDIMREF